MSPTILCDVVVVVLHDDSDVVVAYLYTYSVPDNFTFFLSIWLYHSHHVDKLHADTQPYNLVLAIINIAIFINIIIIAIIIMILTTIIIIIIITAAY